MTECTNWSQPDGDHFHGLCVNEFEPEVGADGCPICVSPMKFADVQPCWICDGNTVPTAFTISGNPPGYLATPTTVTQAYERTVISKVDGGTAVARSEWTSERLLGPTGGGTFTLLPDPSPHCTANRAPYIFGQMDYPCAVRVYGEMQVRAYIRRGGMLYNNGSFSTFTRPTTPPRTDRMFPITNIDPGANLEWGPVTVSLEENPHHLRSIIGINTLFYTPGALTCSSLGGTYPPDFAPVLYSYAAEIEALRQSLIDPANTGNPVLVDYYFSGFFWVLKLTTRTVSGVKMIVGDLLFFRRHSIRRSFVHNGVASTTNYSSFDPAYAFWNPTTYPTLDHRAHLSPLSANDGPVYILSPISTVNMPLGTKFPNGWFQGAADILSPNGFPDVPDPDPPLIIPGQLFPVNGFLRSQGVFMVPCTANSATANMSGPTGTSAVSVSW